MTGVPIASTFSQTLSTLASLPDRRASALPGNRRRPRQGTKVLLVKQNAHCAHAALALVGTDEIARRIRNLRLMRRSEAAAFPPEGRRVSGLA
jgi:hypothetical protein